MAKIKGKWRWNSLVRKLSNGEEISCKVLFTSADTEPSAYSNQRITIKGAGYGSITSYNVSSGSVSDPLIGYHLWLGNNITVVTEGSGNADYLKIKEGSNIINFGQTEQEISDELLNYILQNATPVIPLVTEFLIQRDTLTDTADSIRKYLARQNHYIFSSEVIYGVIPNTICTFFHESIDSTNPDEEGVFASHDTKRFDAVGYEKNNEGIVVPVLYEFVDANILIDKYFYVETVSGSDMGVQEEEFLDKWRKIETIPAGEDETDFCTWESAEKQYAYTNHVVKSKDVIYTMSPLTFPDQIAEVYATGLSASGIKNANEEVY